MTQTQTQTQTAEAGDVTTSYQNRVDAWLIACFGETIAPDRQERNHRFLEEALELVQACECTAGEAHQLVDYVFGRPVGDPRQESGGVSNTHAALCLAQGIDMEAAAEAELARVWTKVEKIRAKQAAKPKHSPLPEASPAPHAPAAVPEELRRLSEAAPKGAWVAAEDEDREVICVSTQDRNLGGFGAILEVDVGFDEPYEGEQRAGAELAAAAVNYVRTLAAAPAAVPEEVRQAFDAAAEARDAAGFIGTPAQCIQWLSEENDRLRTLAAAPAAPPTDGTDLHRRLVALLERESVRDGTFDDLARSILDTVAPPADGGTAEDRDDVLFAFHRYVDNPTPFEVTWWTRHFPQFADDIRGHAVEVIDMRFRAEATRPASPAPAASAGGEGAPPDELTRDEILRRAKALLSDRGVKRHDRVLAFSVTELMADFGMELSAKPATDRCAHPECGCDPDAVCGAALAPAAQAQPAGREEIARIIRARVAISLEHSQAIAEAILAARPVAEGDAEEALWKWLDERRACSQGYLDLCERNGADNPFQRGRASLLVELAQHLKGSAARPAPSPAKGGTV